MRKVVVALLLALALAPATATAQEEPKPSAPAPPAPAPKPRTEDEAIAAVLDAWKAKDEAKLRDLALKDDPDPWIVADSLCAAGEHDVAADFAKAAPRPDTEALPAFVESRRRGRDDTERRELLRGMSKALAAMDYTGVLASTAREGRSNGTSPVLAIRIDHSRGMALRGLQQMEECVLALREAGLAAREVGWIRRAAEDYHECGRAAQARADWDAALDAWTNRLACEERRCNRVGVAMSLSGLGSIHFSMGDYPTALKYHEKADQSHDGVGDPAGKAEIAFGLGNTHLYMGQPQLSLSCFESALVLMEALGDRKGVAAALASIGNVHVALWNHEKAISCLERALRMQEDCRDLVGAAMTRLSIGNARHLRGEFDEAVSCFELALGQMEKSGDRRGMLAALQSLGNTRYSLSDYPSALSCYERALALAELLGDRAGVLVAEVSIGTVYYSMGDLAKALLFQERGLEVARALGLRGVVASTLNSIGAVHVAVGDSRKALSTFEQAMAELGELEDRQLSASILANLGVAYKDVGNYAMAMSYGEKAYQALDELGDGAGAARSMLGVGNIQFDLGQYPQALSSFERALKSMEALGDRAGAASVLMSVGSVHCELKDYKAALSFYERALALSEELGDRPREVSALWCLAINLGFLGDHKRSVAVSKRAVMQAAMGIAGLSEAEQALSRQAESRGWEVGALQAAWVPSPGDLAFFLESGRAGALRESLGAREALQGVAIPQKLLDAESMARSHEIAAAATLLKAIREGNAAAVKEARRALGDAREAIGEVVGRIQREAKGAATVVYCAVDDLHSIRRQIQPGEALVLFGVFAEKDSVALVVTSEKARIVCLGSEAVVSAVALLRPEDGSVDPAKAAEALRELVVAPLLLGEDIRRVLVSPDGALSYVPFALLMPEKEVVYVPSGTVYGLLVEEKGKKGEGVLALGDPDYGKKTAGPTVASLRSGWDLTPLPASRDEAKAVGTTTLLGKEATEDGLKGALAKQPRWRSVHFACHGLLDAERPMFSSLALTPAGEEDGFLTVLEVFRMKCPADLVVLSACETGKGKVIRGEGIIGLTRGFMFAGAPRVLVSLWKVDDEATKALMVKFYELWNGGKGAAAALKDAQAFVAGHEKWKHPKYWAAWVLWGLPE